MRKLLPLLLLIFWQPSGAESLSGPAFSDTHNTVDMPPGWDAMPIDRSDWQADIDLAVTLDQHLYPALLPLIKTFAAERGLRIEVQEGTCGISAKKLSDREADVGGFCCPAGETDRLPGLQYHTLGIAALALLVNEDNPIASVNSEQAQDLFRGRINDWRTLGWDQPAEQSLVRPIGRLHCKTRPGHWRLLLDNEDLFSPRLYEVSTIADMISTVAHTRGSIGYETLWMVERFRDKGRVKVLMVDGHRPDDMQALASGRYPFYRTYQITTWNAGPGKSAEATALVDYIQAHFDQVESRYGLLPVAQLRKAGWQFEQGELVAPPRP